MKSTLTRDYLGKAGDIQIEIPSRFKYTYNEKGLSVYNATLLKQWPNNAKYLWFAPEKALNVAVSCGSAILCMSLQGTYIEVIVENYVGRDDDTLGKILQSCKDALDRMNSILIKFTYKLALEYLA